MSAGGDSGDDGAGQADWMRSGINADAPAPAPAGIDAARPGRWALRHRGLLAATALLVVVLGVGLPLAGGGGGPPDDVTAEPTPSSSAPTPGTPGPTAGEPPTAVALPPPPLGTDGIDPGSAATALGSIAPDDPLAPLVGACSSADAGACAALADELAQRCFRGDGRACDLLFSVATAGSTYQVYGGTCGRRTDLRHAGACDALVPPIERPPAPPS